MNELLYWAFGSNTSQDRIELRLGPVEKVGIYVLENYHIVFNAGFNNSCANIAPFEGRRVEGVLYRLNERQIYILDNYEGYPRIYEKFYKIYDNSIIFGYWSKIDHPGRKPDLYYLNHLIKGAKENNLTETYDKLIAYKNNNYKLKIAVSKFFKKT